MLKYTHEQKGCPWNSDTNIAAFENDDKEMLTYLKKEHCPEETSEIDSMDFDDFSGMESSDSSDFVDFSGSNSSDS